MASERLTISLAPDVRKCIDDAIEAGGYSSASDFIATLIRNHQQGEALDHLILEGLESGPATLPDKSYWADKKAALKKHATR